VRGQPLALMAATAGEWPASHHTDLRGREEREPRLNSAGDHRRSHGRRLWHPLSDPHTLSSQLWGEAILRPSLAAKGNKLRVCDQATGPQQRLGFSLALDRDC
jgi:hypothetical protein